MIGLIVFVHYETNDVPSEAQVVNPKAVAEENREARILMQQGQAPHTVSLSASLGSSGAARRAAVRGAVTAYMRTQIRKGVFAGPVSRAQCAPADAGAAGSSGASTGSAGSGGSVFHCQVTAASVTYPFSAVLDSSTKQVTYCRIEQAPIASMKVPVSARCR